MKQALTLERMTDQDHTREGGFQLWKISMKGGTPIQVTKNGGVYGVESDDGRFIYYSKYEHPGIWRMPLQGGTETRILDQPNGWEWFNWALVRNGIYFLNPKPEPNGSIDFFDFATHKRIAVYTLDKPRWMGLTISPDHTSILYVQAELADSSIMLVKNFR